MLPGVEGGQFPVRPIDDDREAAGRRHDAIEPPSIPAAPRPRGESLHTLTRKWSHQGANTLSCAGVDCEGLGPIQKAGPLGRQPLAAAERQRAAQLHHNNPRARIPARHRAAARIRQTHALRLSLGRLAQVLTASARIIAKTIDCGIVPHEVLYRRTCLATHPSHVPGFITIDVAHAKAAQLRSLAFARTSPDATERRPHGRTVHASEP